MLVDYLLAGNVEPGSKIPSERKLAEAMGVGRSVVRDALKSLTLLGVVDVRQGDGTYLKSMKSDLLPQTIEWGLWLGAKRTRDLVEARRYLEVLVAGLAAERRDEQGIRDLQDLIAEMEQVGGDADRFVAADVAFHLRVAEAAGNETLLQIMSSIRSLLQVWISRVMHAATDFEPSRSEHVGILRAIESHDPEGARAAMEHHMSGATERLEATLAGHPEFVT